MSAASTDEATLRQMEQLQREAEAQPLLDEKRATAALLEKYTDAAFTGKIQTLAKAFPYFRAARGDGNCFYRAYAFGLMEWLTQEAQRATTFLQQLKSSYDMALAAGFDAFTTEDFYETVEELFKRLESESSSALREALNDDGVSNYVVAYLRIVTAAYMKTHADDFQPFLEEGMTVDEFCNRHVNPFGVECEHHQIRALTAALRAGVVIAYLDRSDGDEAAKHEIVSEGDPVVCHLLYRPGHYDLLYSAE